MGTILHFFTHIFIAIAAVAGLAPTASPVATLAPVVQTASPSPSVFALHATTQPNNVVTSDGQYQMLGQSVTYHLQFPKQGGPISGNFTGSCTGTVKGNYAGGEGGAMSGAVNGTCQVAFIHSPVSATFTGHIYQNAGKLDIAYDGNIGSLHQTGTQVVMFTP